MSGGNGVLSTVTMGGTLRGENFTPVNSIAKTRMYRVFLADGKLRLKDIA
jgi:hypothetical protein